MAFGWKGYLGRRAREKRDALARKLYTVRLGDYELCDLWHEGWPDDEDYDERFGQSADDRWFKTYDVYLIDQEGSAVGGARWAGGQFFMHYPICSPAMKQNSDPRLAAEMRVALVQSQFDEPSAFKSLENYLVQLEPLPVPELVERLKYQLYFLSKG